MKTNIDPIQANTSRWLALACLGFMAIPSIVALGELGAQSLRSGDTTTAVKINSMEVDGAPIDLQSDAKLRLSPQPRTVSFEFGPATNAGLFPARIRFKLDGYEEKWRELDGSMRLSIRFLDDVGDQVDETKFRIIGESEGWTGDPGTAAFTQRREEFVVPPRATKYWVVMTSAGPPATVGVYAITNLVIKTRPSTDAPPIVSLPWAFEDAIASATPAGWIRDGLRPSMAGVFASKSASRNGGFVIMDDDLNGHAEWATTKEFAKSVNPGDLMIVDWSEAYSFGLVKPESVSYPDLPAGYYRFRVNTLSISGMPTETEASLAFEVPMVFWQTPWFWVSVVTMTLAAGVVVWRVSSSRSLRYELQRLEQHRAVDHERLRIAQDIHDDLGARVTQISLVSAVAESKTSLPEEARSEFSKISLMTRDLVSALYETVWAVNPENDNLDALTNFLCQMSSQHCSQAQLRCRLEVPDIPPEIIVSSQVRHDLIMAVKEAVTNVIKHARATEVRIQISLQSSLLNICIHDDGCGFDPKAAKPGNGLNNLERRMKKIGGGTTVESRLGAGTDVYLSIPVAQPGETG